MFGFFALTLFDPECEGLLEVPGLGKDLVLGDVSIQQFLSLLSLSVQLWRCDLLGVFSNLVPSSDRWFVVGQLLLHFLVVLQPFLGLLQVLFGVLQGLAVSVALTHRAVLSDNLV